MKANDYGVRAIGVKSLPTEKLKANPHNPRMLFDRADLHVLRESIERVGILVPLTVYQEKSTGHYVILDGQRRWMCAQEVGLKTIPVNEVAEPTARPEHRDDVPDSQAAEGLGVDAHSTEA